IPTVCGTVLGSYLARQTAGKFATYKIIRFSYCWMAVAIGLNVMICWQLPASPFWNILPIVLYNIGMALTTPILSIAALDRLPKLRGTAASGQAFVQMVFSTVSAGLLIPLIWFSPLGLALGMAGYWLIAILCVSRSNEWVKK
ncbi:MAG TPA: Bcr/CflA family drug resistance efflux transporter, partial [Methyloradius sp.]